MSIPLQIPAGATLDVVDGGLALRNAGDVVLHGEHTFVEVSAGGTLTVEGSLTCARVRGGAVRVTGSLTCDDVKADAITLAGTIEAKRIEGTHVVLEGTLKVASLAGDVVEIRATHVEAKGIQAKTSVLLGPATYAVEVVLAPSVEIDPAASGRINVLECHNTPPQNGLKGKFRLAEYAEFTGVDPAEFLSQRGVEPLAPPPDAPADSPLPEPTPEPAPEAAAEPPGLEEETTAPQPIKKARARKKALAQETVVVPAPEPAQEEITADLNDPFTGALPEPPEDPFAEPAELQAAELQPVEAAEVDDGTRRLDFLFEDSSEAATDHNPEPVEDDVPPPGALLEDAPPEAAPLLPPDVISLSSDDIEELDLDAIESLDEPDSQLEIIDEDSLSDVDAPLVLDADTHRVLVDSVAQITGAYPVTLPPQVERLRTLVNQSEYRMVQDELPDLYNGLLREHLAASTRPQRRVYAGFNRIHAAVHGR